MPQQSQSGSFLENHRFSVCAKTQRSWGCDNPQRMRQYNWTDAETARNRDRPVDCTAFTSDPFIAEQIWKGAASSKEGCSSSANPPWKCPHRPSQRPLPWFHGQPSWQSNMTFTDANTKEESRSGKCVEILLLAEPWQKPIAQIFILSVENTFSIDSAPPRWSTYLQSH